MYTKLIYPLVLFVLILSACSSPGNVSVEDDSPSPNLESTLAAQGTMISYLATAVGGRSYPATPPPTTAPTFTPAPTTPTPTTLKVYPLEVRTTIPEVNTVIEAMLSGEPDARVALVGYTKAECIKKADALGGPPVCNPGEAEGSIVEVFPLSGPEGHFARPEQIDSIFDFPVKGLYAVYSVPEDAYEADYWPAGAYGLIFLLAESSAPHGAIGVIVEDGKIVRLDYYYGDWLGETFESRAGEMVLPPLKE